LSLNVFNIGLRCNWRFFEHNSFTR